MRRLRAALLAAAAVVAAGTSRADGLLVHAAASLSDVLKELGAAHERATGVDVALNLLGSNVLARQIREGAPGDLAFFADEARMDELERAGLLAAGTRTSLLSGSLVVIVRVDSALRLTSSADLAATGVASVALADPASVPAGLYAKEHLQRVGAWERVRPKLVPTENVRGALSAVASGNVDAAIVYATDARASSEVRVAVAIPAAETPAIRYPVAVLAGSEHPEQARALLAFLRSPEAAAVFRRHGFVVREP
jgi:molybdate transport system substrate-binding protein